MPEERRPESGPEPSAADRIEPEVDPDSQERIAEEHPDPPHAASRFDAGTGQGTVTGPPYDSDFQERPILDGSTQSPAAEASIPNPYRGETDPAAVHRQPALNSTSTNRWLIASVIAAAVVVAVLLLLLQWSPLWCGIGIVVALVSLILMLVVRASPLPLKPRLRVEAALMAVLWLVPLAIIITVLITAADQIW